MSLTSDRGPHADGAPDADTARLEELGYQQELSRTMSLRDVIVYGLVFMVPLAPVSVFGTIYNFSNGMVALVYLVAAVAMLFSAISYREMAQRFPVAGSVYSYVRFGTNPFVGFLAGWAILLDYLLLPALLCIFGASALAALLPSVPQWIWVVAFITTAAAINLRGIAITARINLVFLVIQGLALTVFVVGAVIAVLAGRAEFSLAPLYQPDVFTWGLVFGAIPIAALSYIGFDAISTLNEEAQGGGQTVAKATMVVLVLVTVMFVVQTYLAALFGPTSGKFPEGTATDNAFYDLAGVVIAPWFKVVFTLITALVAIFANTIVSHATSSRLLFSMARDGQLPSVLGRVSSAHKVPRAAMLTIALTTLVLGVIAVGQIEIMTTLVTFGALTAYILLHVAVLRHFAIAGRSRAWFSHWLSPVLGIAILGYALWSTNAHAKILGLSWLVVGCLIAFLLRRAGRSLETSDVV